MFLAQRGCTCLAAQLASIATRSFSRITVSNSTFHLLNNASNRQSIFNISGDTIARSFASKASDTSSGNGQDKSSKQTTEECKPDASCQPSLTLNSSCIKVIHFCCCWELVGSYIFVIFTETSRAKLGLGRPQVPARHCRLGRLLRPRVQVHARHAHQRRRRRGRERRLQATRRHRIATVHQRLHRRLLRGAHPLGLSRPKQSSFRARVLLRLIVLHQSLIRKPDLLHTHIINT